MTVADLSLDLRRAVVAHLRADDALIALVPSASIYGEFATSDVFPFIRMGYSTATGFETSGGWSGSDHDFTIHVFADGPGTDAVYRICAAVVASMEEFEPALLGLPQSEWISTVVLPDVVAEKLHGVVRYRLAVVIVE